MTRRELADLEDRHTANAMSTGRTVSGPTSDWTMWLVTVAIAIAIVLLGCYCYVDMGGGLWPAMLVTYCPGLLLVAYGQLILGGLPWRKRS